jgi:hypothetical protein
MWRKRRKKYNNTVVSVDGIKFDSKKEAARYKELKTLQRVGVICNLETQPTYKISIGGVTDPATGRKMAARRYTADFRYLERGEVVVEEIKSAGTRKETAYRLRRQLFLEQYGSKIIFKEL